MLVSLKPKSTWVNDRAWGELTLRTEPHPETRSFSSSLHAKSHVCRAVTVQGKMPHRGRRAKPAFSAWVGFREYCKLDLIHVHTPFLFMLSCKTSVASITIFTCSFSEKLIFRTNAIKYLNTIKVHMNLALQFKLDLSVYLLVWHEPECGLQKQCGVSVCFLKDLNGGFPEGHVICMYTHSRFPFFHYSRTLPYSRII